MCIFTNDLLASKEKLKVPFFVVGTDESVNDGVTDIEQSELDMLNIYSKRAELNDNTDILELGCGWGSLTLYMAQKYPKSNITAVSNSNDQRKYIQNKCKKLNINNIKVITCDMNDFLIDEKFDRVISILLISSFS